MIFIQLKNFAKEFISIIIKLLMQYNIIITREKMFYIYNYIKLRIIISIIII